MPYMCRILHRLVLVAVGPLLLLLLLVMMMVMVMMMTMVVMTMKTVHAVGVPGPVPARTAHKLVVRHGALCHRGTLR